MKMAINNFKKKNYITKPILLSCINHFILICLNFKVNSKWNSKKYFQSFMTLNIFLNNSGFLLKSINYNSELRNSYE